MPNNEFDERNYEDLEAAFSLADSVLLRKYLHEIRYYPIRTDILDDRTDGKGTIIQGLKSKYPIGKNIALYKVDRLVYDKNENLHDKLVTIYSALCSENRVGIAFILQGNSFHIDLYIAYVTKEEKSSGVKAIGERINNIFLGQFPGSKTEKYSREEIADDDKAKETLIEEVFNKAEAITSVSGVAALRNQSVSDSEQFVQGMEKLVDSMRGRQFTAIYLADAMKPQEVESLCAQYEDLYSTLSPFKQSSHTLTKNDSVSDTTGSIEGVVNTTNENIAKALTYGTTSSITKTDTIGGSAGVSLGGPNSFVHANISANYSHSKARTEAKNQSETNTTSYGTAKSLTSQNSVAKAITQGTGESLQIVYDNRAVMTLLNRIDEQIKRLRTCEDFGLFNSCVYFISSDYANAVAAATAYQSLMRGENSSVESLAVNVWEDKEDIQIVSEYLKRFYHPEFGKEIILHSKDDNSQKKADHEQPNKVDDTLNEDKYYINVTPAVMVSGKELSYQFSLPKKSVSGLPVIETATFGRDVIELYEAKQGNIDLGNIFHMGSIEGEKKDENSDNFIPNVKLSIQELAAHTFITGSTGSGKSNTIYQILSELKKKGKTFMVVEPAKGEYSSVLGDKDVAVYGTNPKISQLLKLNPFSFPTEVHVLEHLERLVSIFNVCWPMYAAMPAILKDAMERSYIDAGWDLTTSENKYGNNLYPTFEDVLVNIKKVLDESDYSADNKGDYTGALVTRLRSLTNGLYGMIFTANEITGEDLFDKNVIVDLSRVGSSETKSLIMALLVLKLSEYRMSTHKNANEDLKHITVLEEAHNILKRTSTEQSSESANLAGKSVEMLANAIAEMRTYGEGFIIADQSPGNMDMSVIRNTNTKIIMRLPDYSDRELVGRAASLNDEQIAELSKLERGVAAVIQGNWLEAVLCKVKKYEGAPNNELPHEAGVLSNDKSVKEQLIKALISLATSKTLDIVEVEKLKDIVLKSNMAASIKSQYMEFITKETGTKSSCLRKLLYCLLNADKIERFIGDSVDVVDIRDEVIKDLNLLEYTSDMNQRNIVVGLILYEQSERSSRFNKIFQLYTERLRGGLL